MTAPVREGEILAGKYRVDRVLGMGGMGVVVAATHLELDEKVAVKFLLPETLRNAEAVARFAREARAAVKIKSEHVARVSDVGKLEGGAPYMVMEYLDGSDLSSWITERGVLPEEQAVEFILQACEAVAEAHALGIIHRDLKPANLFVIRRPDGGLSVKVLDFGISKMTDPASSGAQGMTSTSATMGSPLYMSPEQMRSSKDVDARGDIWAVGVILYELLCGVSPFRGDSMPELVVQIMSSPPSPMRTHRRDVSAGLEAVILKCLDKDRGRRYPTVGELALALLPFAPKRSRMSVERISGVMKAAGYSSTALALPSSSSPGGQVGAGTAASWGTTAPPGGSGRWALIAGAGAVVVLGAGFFLTKGGGDASQPAVGTDVPSANTAAAAPAAPPAMAPVEPAIPAAAPPPPPVEAPSAAPVEATPAAATPSPVKPGQAPKKGAPPAPSSRAPAAAVPAAPPPAPPPATPAPATAAPHTPPPAPAPPPAPVPRRNPLDIRPQ